MTFRTLERRARTGARISRWRQTRLDERLGALGITICRDDFAWTAPRRSASA
jgi:hypothetical protein